MWTWEMEWLLSVSHSIVELTWFRSSHVYLFNRKYMTDGVLLPETIKDADLEKYWYAVNLPSVSEELVLALEWRRGGADEELLITCLRCCCDVHPELFRRLHDHLPAHLLQPSQMLLVDRGCRAFIEDIIASVGIDTSP